MDGSNTLMNNKKSVPTVYEVSLTNKLPVLMRIKQEPIDQDELNNKTNEVFYDSSKVIKSEPNCDSITVKQEPQDEFDSRDNTECSKKDESEVNSCLSDNVKQEPESEEELGEECEDGGSYNDNVDVDESDVKSECNKDNSESNKSEKAVDKTSQNQNTPSDPKPYKVVATSGGNRYACTICDKTFSTSFYVKIHQRIHSGDKPFECDICNMKFSFSPVLKRHRRTHSGEKPYECKICMKKFTRPSSLTQHKRNHPYNEYMEEVFVDSTQSDDNNIEGNTQRGRGTKKPYYECDGCMKRFNHSSNLKRHRRIRVRGETYDCDVCKKNFIRSSCLKTHKRIHTDKKVYECNVCTKKFSRLSHLKRHAPSHESNSEQNVPLAPH